jgi:hypothetical protein
VSECGPAVVGTVVLVVEVQIGKHVQSRTQGRLEEVLAGKAVDDAQAVTTWVSLKRRDWALVRRC